MNRNGVITCARVLHTLLVSDDDYADSERDFFEKLIQGLGLSAEEQTEARVPMPTAEVEEAVQALPHALRQGQLEALVEGALADGRVDDREKALINRVAAALGVSDEALEWIWQKNSR